MDKLRTGRFILCQGCRQLDLRAQYSSMTEHDVQSSKIDGLTIGELLSLLSGDDSPRLGTFVPREPMRVDSPGLETSIRINVTHLNTSGHLLWQTNAQNKPDNASRSNNPMELEPG